MGYTLLFFFCLPNYLTLAETRALGGANCQVIEFCVFLFYFFCMLRTVAPVLTWHLRSADRSRRYSNPRARYLMMFLRFRTTFLCYCYCFYCCCCCFCSCTMPCMQQGDALVALEKSGHSYVAAGLTFCFLSFFLSLWWPFAAAAAHRPLSMSIEWNSKIFAFVILFLFSLLFFCSLDLFIWTW